jgi:hypothetical protein
MDVIGAGLEAILQPRSIAIIGASQDPTKIGGRPVELLRRPSFARAVEEARPFRRFFPLGAPDRD